jgi:hypothetical protein
VADKTQGWCNARAIGGEYPLRPMARAPWWRYLPEAESQRLIVLGVLFSSEVS